MSNRRWREQGATLDRLVRCGPKRRRAQRTQGDEVFQRSGKVARSDETGADEHERVQIWDKEQDGDRRRFGGGRGRISLSDEFEWRRSCGVTEGGGQEERARGDLRADLGRETDERSMHE